MGFVRSKHDYCLYLVVYVDDLRIAAVNEANIERVKTTLMQKFEMTDMKELHNFLEIKIHRDLDRGLVKLPQQAKPRR